MRAEGGEEKECKMVVERKGGMLRSIAHVSSSHGSQGAVPLSAERGAAKRRAERGGDAFLGSPATRHRANGLFLAHRRPTDGPHCSSLVGLIASQASRLISPYPLPCPCPGHTRRLGRTRGPAAVPH